MSILDLLLDLIYPPYCLSCGAYGPYICKKCLKFIDVHPIQKCPYCNKKSLLGTTHEQCKTDLSINGIYAITHKNQILTDILKQIKYRMATDVHHAMITILKKHIPQHLIDSDLIIPVPAHASRIHWRGFNYPDMIAKSLSQELHIPTSNLLIKTKKTLNQADISDRQSRLNNLKHAFALHPQVKKSAIQNKSFIIVDDVTTTGSTITNAAIPLKQAGAKQIWGLVLAR